MKKPVIAITMSKGKDRVEGSRDFIPSAYAAAIRRAGGLPLLIPNDFPVEEIPELTQRINGVLLSGGGDVSPSLYHEKDRFPLSNVRKERDAIEMSLAALAIEKDLPLLGICRGEQLLNVALGGTLYQHLPVEHSSEIKHDTPDSYEKDYIAHQVTIARDSFLYRVLGAETIEVNSRHHQAVRQPGTGLAVPAHASDGLIEAIELPARKFCIGVQWHPENLQSMPVHQRLFDAFIHAARK